MEQSSKMVCTSCNTTATEADNYCGNCGAGPDPWEEQATYDFERDVDLPYHFSVNVGGDDWQLWRNFCYDVWGHKPASGNIDNAPCDLPRMKYNMAELHYVLTEDYELKGPFLEKP